MDEYILDIQESTQLILEKLNESPPWFDSDLVKLVSCVEGFVSLIAISVGLYFFSRGFEIPYRIRYWLSFPSSRAKILLTCTNRKIDPVILYKVQRFVYELDHILWKEKLTDDKNGSIGLRSWIKDGKIPLRSLLNGLNELVEINFSQTQKDQYEVLNILWKRSLGLTIDKELLIVYIHSVLAIYGLVLREWMLYDDLLTLVCYIQDRSLNDRAEFSEKETTQVRDMLSFLITSVVDRAEFIRLVNQLFLSGDFRVTTDKKDQIIIKFMELSTPGGNNYDY